MNLRLMRLMFKKILLSAFIFCVSTSLVRARIFSESPRLSTRDVTNLKKGSSAPFLSPKRIQSLPEFRRSPLSTSVNSETPMDDINKVYGNSKTRVAKNMSLTQIIDGAQDLINPVEEVTLDYKIDLFYRIGTQELPEAFDLIGTKLTPNGKGVVKYFQAQEGYVLEQVYDSDGNLKQDWYYLPEKYKWLLKQYEDNGNVSAVWVSWNRDNNAAYFPAAKEGYRKVITLVEGKYETMILDSAGNLVEIEE